MRAVQIPERVWAPFLAVRRLALVRRGWDVLWRLVLLGALAVLLFPIAYLVTVSLKGQSDVLSGRFLPSRLAIENWPAAYSAVPLVMFLRNSVVVAASSALLTLAVALPAVYACARYRIGGRILPALVISSYVAPPVVALIPLFYLVRAVGLINTLPGLMIVHALLNVPVAFWLLDGFVRQVPIEIEEAAAVDGAGPLTVLWRITTPLVAPGLAAAGIICGILSYNELLFALVLTYSPASQTLPVGVSLFQGDKLVQFGQMAVASLSGMVPVYLLALFGQRWLIEGLTAGGIR